MSRRRHAGAYFNKIQCFCFTEQRIEAGRERARCRSFLVDPAIVKDRDQNGLDTITLSYTFYPDRDQERPVAETPAPNSKKS